MIVYDINKNCIIDVSSVEKDIDKFKEKYSDKNRYYIAYIIHPKENISELDDYFLD